MKAAKEAGPEDLLHADGYIFCAPENLAAIAGIMKDFFDRCYYPVLGRIEGRVPQWPALAASDTSGGLLINTTFHNWSRQAGLRNQYLDPSSL